MKATNFLIGLWAVIAVYTFLSFFYGPAGLSAYGQLLVEREGQLNNIAGLNAINDELERSRNSLLFDRDTILAHARRLGFGEEGDRYIRIVGHRLVTNLVNAEGAVFYAAAPDFLADRVIKAISLCIGLIVAAILFAFDFINSKT